MAAAAATYWSLHSYRVQTAFRACAAVLAHSKNSAASRLVSSSSAPLKPILRLIFFLLASSRAESMARSWAALTASDEMRW